MLSLVTISQFRIIHEYVYLLLENYVQTKQCFSNVYLHTISKVVPFKEMNSFCLVLLLQVSVSMYR